MFIINDNNLNLELRLVYMCKHFSWLNAFNDNFGNPQLFPHEVYNSHLLPPMYGIQSCLWTPAVKWLFSYLSWWFQLLSSNLWLAFLLKRLSTIETCKIENLCWKVLLIFFIFCRYFGNIPLMISYLCVKISYIILQTTKWQNLFLAH